MMTSTTFGSVAFGTTVAFEDAAVAAKKALRTQMRHKRYILQQFCWPSSDQAEPRVHEPLRPLKSKLYLEVYL